MRFILISFLIFLGLNGCSQRPNNEENQLAVSKDISVNPETNTQGSKDEPTQTTLAYEHRISFDVDESAIVTIYDATLNECKKASQQECLIINSDFTDDEYKNAMIKIRATPKEIEKITKLLNGFSGMTSHNISAENLAGPISDSSKKLAMLKAYRDRLEQLMNRSDANIDTLLKISQELAQTQSEIEIASGENADLVLRTQTQLLTIFITSEKNRSFFSPISNAFKETGHALSKTLSGLILFLIYTLPWIITIFLVIFGFKKSKKYFATLDNKNKQEKK